MIDTEGFVYDVIEIMGKADGGCSACCGDLLRLLVEKYPTQIAWFWIWQDLRRRADPWLGNVLGRVLIELDVESVVKRVAEHPEESPDA